MLNDVVGHARQDLGKISEPKAQALFETTAEVCSGLVTAFEHYERQESRLGGGSRPAACSGGAVRAFLRGAVWLHILHHAAGQEIHGAWMAAELARHGYQSSPGTRYPTLHRTQDEGLLTSRQVTVNGKVRRLHRITDPGRGVLAAGRKAVAELAGEVLAGDPAQQEWQR
jgi:DNA-binding PadR family transcriptional regulator